MYNKKDLFLPLDALRVLQWSHDIEMEGDAFFPSYAHQEIELGMYSDEFAGQFKPESVEKIAEESGFDLGQEDEVNIVIDTNIGTLHIFSDTVGAAEVAIGYGKMAKAVVSSVARKGDIEDTINRTDWLKEMVEKHYGGVENVKKATCGYFTIFEDSMVDVARVLRQIDAEPFSPANAHEEWMLDEINSEENSFEKDIHVSFYVEGQSGFYETYSHESMYDHALMRHEVEDDGLTEEVKRLEIAFAKNYLENLAGYVSHLAQESPLDILAPKFEFKEMYSPQYYNFQTDSIICNVSNPSSLQLVIYSNWPKEYEEYIKEATARRDGFIPYHTNDDFHENPAEDYTRSQLGTMVSFISKKLEYRQEDLEGVLDDQ